jgi:hypothetical protein
VSRAIQIRSSKQEAAPMPDDKLSPEDQAFIEDLRKARYDNPELYKDPPGLPQVYKIRINSSLLSGSPAIIRIEIDGDVLRNALTEADFNLLSRSPEAVEGYENFAEFRRDAERVSEFSELQKTQWQFVLRHFPPLFLSFYDITVLSSFVATWLSLWRESPGDDLNEFETLARSALEKQIASFLKHIKLIVDTRAKGRPLGTGTPSEARTQEAEEFEKLVEEAIRRVAAVKGFKRIKTAVAKELHIGGLNVKTGVDSALSVFIKKLNRLEIDYDAIVERIRVAR